MKKELRTIDNERHIVQITTLDERWYQVMSTNKVSGLQELAFYPSSTWIAGYYPKGIQFYKWLADKGWDEAEAIKNAAGDKGSKEHFACNQLARHIEVKMTDKFLNPSKGESEELTPEEYEGVMSFNDWLIEEEPKIITYKKDCKDEPYLEYTVVNDVHEYAGTVDMKCRIKSDNYEHIWIIDLKTGATIWKEWEIQISSYRHADPECQKTAILQVGYKKNKFKKFKFTEIEDKFDLFLNAKRVWKEENEGVSPHQKDYPMSLKWEEKTEATPEEVSEFEKSLDIPVEEPLPKVVKKNQK